MAKKQDEPNDSKTREAIVPKPKRVAKLSKEDKLRDKRRAASRERTQKAREDTYRTMGEALLASQKVRQANFDQEAEQRAEAQVLRTAAGRKRAQAIRDGLKPVLERFSKNLPPCEKCGGPRFTCECKYPKIGE